MFTVFNFHMLSCDQTRNRTSIFLSILGFKKKEIKPICIFVMNNTFAFPLNWLNPIPDCCEVRSCDEGLCSEGTIHHIYDLSQPRVLGTQMSFSVVKSLLDLFLLYLLFLSWCLIIYLAPPPPSFLTGPGDGMIKANSDEVAEAFISLSQTVDFFCLF